MEILIVILVWLAVSLLVIISPLERTRAAVINGFLFVATLAVLVYLSISSDNGIAAIVFFFLGWVSIPLVYNVSHFPKETKKRLLALSMEDRLKEREKTFQRILELQLKDSIRKDVEDEELNRLEAVKKYLDRIC